MAACAVRALESGRQLGQLTGNQRPFVQTVDVQLVADPGGLVALAVLLHADVTRGRQLARASPAGVMVACRSRRLSDLRSLPTTRVLLDRLDTDVVLRRICGWERKGVFSFASRSSRGPRWPSSSRETQWPTSRSRWVFTISADRENPPRPARGPTACRRTRRRSRLARRPTREGNLALPPPKPQMRRQHHVGVQAVQQDARGPECRLDRLGHEGPAGHAPTRCLTACDAPA